MNTEICPSTSSEYEFQIESYKFQLHLSIKLYLISQLTLANIDDTHLFLWIQVYLYLGNG